MAVLTQTVPGPKLTCSEIRGVLAHLNAGGDEDPPVAFLGLDEVAESDGGGYLLIDPTLSGRIERVVLKISDEEFIVLRRTGQVFREHERVNPAALAVRH